MITIEEESNEYVRRKFGFATACQVKDTFNVFKAGVEFAQRWILFEDERPQEFQQVLVKCKGKGDKIYLSEYLGYGNGSFADTTSTVICWRPVELK